MTSHQLQQAPSTNDNPSIFCIIVNWNGWRDTLACLQSLMAQDYPHLKVLVVDNASSDDSVSRIREAYPQVTLMESGANLGFSGGCNVGIRAALAMDADFVWLLNNDTVAPPDTLARLYAAAGDQKIGIVGTVLRFMHDPSLVQAWGGGKVLRWMGYTIHFTSPSNFGEDTFLTFASVLIRRELFLDIGLLDEGYFMYFDDSDFCFRARRAGWKLAIATDTAVLHKEGASADSKKSPRMDRISTASGLRFLRLHRSLPLLAMFLFLSSRFAERLLFADLSGLRAVWLGFTDWSQPASYGVQGEGMTSASNQRALIIKFGAIGDVLMAIPAVHALHQQGLQIDWVCGHAVAPLLACYPWIQTIVANDRALLTGSKPTQFKALASLWRTLAGRQYTALRHALLR